MATLTAHLRTPEDHGRLSFHPQCPLCLGERLAGTLPADAVVDRRGQALVAAGVLALSSATPATTLAADPDREQEGSAAPEQVVVTDPQADSTFDPGGETTDLPFIETPTSEQTPPDTAADAGPQPEPEPATEPATDDETPVIDQGDDSDPPVTPPTPEPVAAPPAAVPMTPEPPAATEPVAVPPSGAQPREAAPKRQPRDDNTAPRPRPAAPAPYPAPPAVTLQPEPRHIATAQVAQARPTAGSAAAAPRAARRGDRFHVVRRGESLWSIASDLVGDGASPARIAREVNRLWELNSARIGTGDPDLLMAETRLALR